MLKPFCSFQSECCTELLFLSMQSCLKMSHGGGALFPQGSVFGGQGSLIMRQIVRRSTSVTDNSLVEESELLTA